MYQNGLDNCLQTTDRQLPKDITKQEQDLRKHKIGGT